MRFAPIAMAIFGAFSVSSQATQVYKSYDSFYADQPGAVFKNPVKRDSNIAYSDPGNNGIFIETRGASNGKKIKIKVTDDSISIDGSKFRFAHATASHGEHGSSLSPQNADVFLATLKYSHTEVICLQADSVGSGESDRHKQIYLLTKPLKRNVASVFLHLPSLLSSCHAVVLSKDAKLVFPDNSYLLDEAKETRTGLLVSYITFDNRRFMPTNTVARLRFISPENPFEFWREDARQ